jgi:CoA:oxalate CoA-transferase
MPASHPMLPLEGMRIIDLTRVISGPFCTMLLGDLGADVIKIEAPEGDTVRGQGALKDGLSWYFAGYNRNKRSVVLNLKDPDDHQALIELVKGADAVIENFRPGVMDRLGLGRDRLLELRPGLVTCAITGFGADGPYVRRPAFDFIAQAMSGFMATNGAAADPPLRSGPPISDLTAGLYAALGVTAALLRRERTGEPEHVDVSLTNSMISMLSYLALDYFASGQVPARTGNDHPIAAPYGLFNARDGAIAIAPNDDVFFGRLMDALSLGEAKKDPAFASNRLRVAQRDKLNAMVEEVISKRNADEWIERLNAAGVPCCRVNSVESVFEDPQVQSQDMAIDVDHPGYGPVRMLGFPIKFRNAPCRVRHPAPGLGQHNGEILAGIKAANTNTPPRS